jgi:tetratricopeptide (TPR) repeat protein
MARRLELIDQAAYVLCEPQRRQVYDELRQARLARLARPADQAERGMACFHAGRFDDAARLLRAASQRAPDNPDSATLHLHYCLSLLYGCAHLASPEDWRVSEMIGAAERAMQASGDSQVARAHHTLCIAIDHYDKDRFAQGWELLSQLTRQQPNWHLPWLISAYWSRREGNMGHVLACAERARRLHPDDLLLAELSTLLRRTWETAPALLHPAAQHAAQILADGTTPGNIASTWR